MNKQIKLLAVQARLPDYLLEYGTELCVAPHLEKFAKLIVQECISTLDKDDGATHHSELLLEHFGVEE
jgi:hypothetical protein